MPRNPPPESRSLCERIFRAGSTSRGIYIHVRVCVRAHTRACVCVLFIGRRDRAGNVKRLAVSPFGVQTRDELAGSGIPRGLVRPIVEAR